MRTYEYDLSTFSPKEKTAWLEAGIIPGPVHLEYECAEYVATVDLLIPDRHRKHLKQVVVDIYIAQSWAWQTVIYRDGEGDEFSYGSWPLPDLLRDAHKDDIYKGIAKALNYLGQITWKRM